jgi:polyhydroxyalkanoate synthesis regulator phasin
MSSDEAKKFVDDVSRKAEDEKKSAQEWIRDQVNKMLQQAGAAEASRVAALEQRVSDLERRVAEQSLEPPTTEAPL